MSPVAPRIELDGLRVTRINHESNVSKQEFYRQEEFSQVTVQSSHRSVKSQFSQVLVLSRNSSVKSQTNKVIAQAGNSYILAVESSFESVR